MRDEKKEPAINGSCYISPHAYISGEVRIEKDCSLWPFSSIRGDEGKITLGERTNVQDGVVIHVDEGFPVRIGKDVTIGHGAIVHGCEIGDRCIIGIRSTILNGARIGKGCIIGAGAVVTPDTEIPPHSMVLGLPGKVKKQDERFEEMAKRNARIYVDLSKRYKKGRVSEYPHQ
ncbi:MAG: gamma carbonic anhydrase family protein [Thermoplasmatota archaeon]